MEENFDIIPNKTIIGERIILSKLEVTFEFASPGHAPSSFQYVYQLGIFP